MKKSIAKNYLYNLSYQILVMILPLITTPYVSRVLGANNIGIYSYTLSITTFFILFGSLGIALYGQREIAYQQEDKSKYSYTFWEIVILRCITMAIALVIYYFTFAIGNNDYNLYYKILIVELLGNMIDISWFFQGLEEFKKTVLRNTLIKLISLVLILTLVKKPDDLPIYYIIYVTATFLGNLSLWLYLPIYLKKVDIKKLNIYKHLKPTISLFVPQIAVQLYTILDKTMIGTIISDKSEVGYYDQAQKVIKMLLTIVTSLGTVMMPRIANTFANGDKEKVNEYMKKSFRMVFFLSLPLIFGILAVANVFVPFFFGQGYEKAGTIMKVISPIILFIGLSNVTGTQYLLPTKRQKEYTTSVICGAVVNLIMNSLLIWKYGAIGAAVGTVLAEFTVMSVQLYFTRNDFKFKKMLLLSKNYVISSVFMYISCVIVGYFIKNGTISLFMQVLVGALIYGFILLSMKDEFVIEILDRVKNKLCRKKWE